MTFNNTIAILATFFGLWLLFHRRIRESNLWHATVTPLASIIGSGFLVSAPLLYATSGAYAPLVMLAIVIFAYALGASLRLNIRYIEPLLGKSHAPLISRIETLSHPILGIAYVISVAFYLKLLSAFALRGFDVHHLFLENTFTTALLLFIGFTGKRRGLSMLEMLETYSVNTKISIIIALITTLFFYNGEVLMHHQWQIAFHPTDTVWQNARHIFGMLIIIQGFETSRFLGHAYPASTRIQTMRYAQLLSGAIYVVFVSVAMVVFNHLDSFSETSVIDACRIAAHVLPFLLVIAAVMSQFSAAVADTIGGAGLVCESLEGKLSINTSYLLMALFAIALTWLTNIYQIIAIASKAFALYYTMQCVISLLWLRQQPAKPLWFVQWIVFSGVLLLLFMVIVFGKPIE